MGKQEDEQFLLGQGFSPEEIGALIAFAKRRSEPKPRGSSVGYYKICERGLSERNAWEQFETLYDPRRPDASDQESTIAEKRQRMYEAAGFTMQEGHIICQWRHDRPPSLVNINIGDPTQQPEAKMRWAISNKGEFAILRVTTVKPNGELQLSELLARISSSPILPNP